MKLFNETICFFYYSQIVPNECSNTDCFNICFQALIRIVEKIIIIFYFFLNPRWGLGLMMGLGFGIGKKNKDSIEAKNIIKKILKKKKFFVK